MVDRLRVGVIKHLAAGDEVPVDAHAIQTISAEGTIPGQSNYRVLGD